MRELIGRRTGHALLLAPPALIAALAAAYFALTGPADPAAYPDAATSPCRLPFPAGKAWPCVQGNRGIVSHHKGGRFAHDFATPRKTRRRPESDAAEGSPAIRPPGR